MTDHDRALRLMRLAELGRAWAVTCRAGNAPVLAIVADNWAESVERLALEEADVPAWVPDNSKQGRV